MIEAALEERRRRISGPSGAIGKHEIREQHPGPLTTDRPVDHVIKEVVERILHAPQLEKLLGCRCTDPSNGHGPASSCVRLPS
jgi:hypothetical protein